MAGHSLWSLTKAYWLSPERWSAWGFVIVIVSANLGSGGIKLLQTLPPAVSSPLCKRMLPKEKCRVNASAAYD